MFERLKTYSCREMTGTPSQRQRRLAASAILGEVLTHPSASNYSQGGFLMNGHSAQGGACSILEYTTKLP